MISIFMSFASESDYFKRWSWLLALVPLTTLAQMGGPRAYPPFSLFPFSAVALLRSFNHPPPKIWWEVSLSAKVKKSEINILKSLTVFVKG